MRASSSVSFVLGEFPKMPPLRGTAVEQSSDLRKGETGVLEEPDDCQASQTPVLVPTSAADTVRRLEKADLFVKTERGHARASSMSVIAANAPLDWPVSRLLST